MNLLQKTKACCEFPQGTARGIESSVFLLLKQIRGLVGLKLSVKGCLCPFPRQVNVFALVYPLKMSITKL